MSTLRIVTQTKALVDPKFCDMFIDILENMSDAPIAMTHLEPLLGNMTPEMGAESNDIQSMAVFMMLSGSTLGVKWGEKFYFGDVDLMDDAHGNWETESTILQYMIEDDLRFKDVYHALKKIDADCMRDGADCIPFTDTEYYAEQLRNIYDMSDEGSELMADKLRKFDIFRATGKDVPDIQKYTDAYGEDPSAWKGRVYLCDPQDQCGLTIESTEDWDEENKSHAWHLLIENCELMSDDILELELELFDWAVSAGWTDDL
jgi:hypothetical protein